tara:strand:+ start:1126 stop:1581 length:456 start_codon:yes stop_codon:yes gene_type:complete
MAERKKIFSRTKPRPHQRKTTWTNPITGRTRTTTKSKFKKDAETSYGTKRPRVKKRVYVENKDGTNIKKKEKEKGKKLGFDKKSVKVKDVTRRPDLYKPSKQKRKEFNFDQDTGRASGKRKVFKDKKMSKPVRNPFLMKKYGGAVGPNGIL